MNKPICAAWAVGRLIKMEPFDLLCLQLSEPIASESVDGKWLWTLLDIDIPPALKSIKASLHLY